jgi:hypothetical protein
VKFRKVRNRPLITSDRLSIVATMTGPSWSDPADGGRTHAPAGRRSGWFSRPKLEPHSDDQEAEVRAQLYARPAMPERTVRRVERIRSEEPIEWVEPGVKVDEGDTHEFSVRSERAEREQATRASRIAGRPAA